MGSRSDAEADRSGSADEETLHLTVDGSRCEGHTLCHLVAPELFDLDPIDGRAQVLVEHPPLELRALATKAANGCPERAIVLRSTRTDS